MRILLSAYSCLPDRGSEPGVGWNFAKVLAEKHEVTILTRREARQTIESSSESWSKRVHWLYYDPPNIVCRLNRFDQLFYLFWQWRCVRFVKRYVPLDEIDLIHHITFGKYWMPSFLGSLGKPLAFGPVGGADRTPVGFQKGYSVFGSMLESCKTAASWLLPRLPGLRKQYRSYSVAFAATDANATALRRLVRCPVFLCPQSAMSSENMACMKGIASMCVVPEDPHFIVACRQNHWKAVDLALISFIRFYQSNPSAKLTIVGTGPEHRKLVRRARHSVAVNAISFVRYFPNHDDLFRSIASSTALLHPALHEAFGQVCLESLALGTPVVCWDWAGPGLVSRLCGNPVVPLTNPETSISSYVATMERIAFEKTRHQGSLLTWDRMLEFIESHYPKQTNCKN